MATKDSHELMQKDTYMLGLGSSSVRVLVTKISGEHICDTQALYLAMLYLLGEY